MSTRFLAGYAARSVRRGGQRSVLAVVCIAFGVLALVAMQLLANVVGRATNIEPRLALGGDLRIEDPSGLVDDDDVAMLERLVDEGMLSGMTTFAAGDFGMLRSSRSGRVRFAGRALGVDIRSWPLAGTLVLSGDASLVSALSEIGSIVLTRDLARALSVVVGDTVRFGGVTRASVRLVVGGIATSMPDRRGQTMLYSMETARLLAGESPLRRWAAATAREDSLAAVRIAGAGLSVQRAVDVEPDTTARVFGTMLRGAGLLGLIIGGIGIAYTLQVMLTRRRLEIATLRALGYRTHHLVVLFGLEAAALGAMGGVLGAGLAVAVSAQLVRLLDRTAGAMMLEYTAAPGLIVAGPLVGMATAVLFGTAAIMRASAVRPSVLLRDMPVRPARGAALGALALNVVLALLFTALAGVVMKSLLAGVAVVLVAAAGIVLLGTALVALLWLVVRLPLPHLPLVNMARANLRSRQVRSAFSLIALFVGVFAIGFAAAAMSTGRDRVAERRGSDAGLNVRVYPGVSDHATVAAALREQGATTMIASHTVAVRVTDSTGVRLPLPEVEIIAASDLVSLVTISPASWTGDRLEVVMPVFMRLAPFSNAIGDRLTIATADDSVRVTIGGFYTPVDTERFSAPRGLIGGAGVARALGVAGGPTSYIAALPDDRLDAAVPALGAQLPSSLVVSRRDINEFLVATYQSLFMFVVAVAGLALVAGAVLIANAVSLAMVERRRELGVLMAVGYTSRRVLRTIVLENGALGLVAGLAGIVAVAVVTAVLNAREASLRLEFGPGAAVALTVTSVVLAMLAAGAVAWGPVHVRPLEVLRDE